MLRQLRRVLVRSLAWLWYTSGLFRLWLRSRNTEVCVLCLHRVLSDEQWNHANSLDGMAVHDGTFRELLEFLNKYFRLISSQGLNDRNGTPDTKPRCLLTFDDGWGDNYTTAFSLLKKTGTPAVIFLVTGMVGAPGGFWPEKMKGAAGNSDLWRQVIAKLKAISGREFGSIEDAVEYLKHMSSRKRSEILAQLNLEVGVPALSKDYDRLMTWPEIREMAAAGIEFEAHTETHPLLNYEDGETVAQELGGAMKTIEEMLGRKVRALAYPNGAWNDQGREEARRAGYKVAFTTQPGWYRAGDDPLTIRRITIHEARIVGSKGRFSPALASLALTGWR